MLLNLIKGWLGKSFALYINCRKKVNSLENKKNEADYNSVIHFICSFVIVLI